MGSEKATSFAPFSSRERRHFASGWQESVYLAARELLRAPGSESILAANPPSVWIGVAGNYAFAPLASFPVGENQAAGAPSPSAIGPQAELTTERVGRADSQLQRRPDLKLFVMGVFLVLAAWWLWRQDGALLAASKKYSSMISLARAAQSVLCVGAAGLALLKLQSLLAASAPPGESVSLATSLSLVFLSLLYGIMVCLLVHVGSGKPTSYMGPLLVILGALVPAMMGALLSPLSLGFPKLFAARSQSFTNGLSPLVPFLFLVGAVFTWFAVEVRRRDAWVRNRVKWPVPDALEPVFAGCKAATRVLKKNVERTFPRWVAGWIAIGLLVVPAHLVLLSRVQPVAEHRFFGYAFVCVMACTIALCLTPVVRFVHLWYLVRRLLFRIASSHLRRVIKQVRAEVAWHPMQLTRPEMSLTTLAESIEYLERVDSDLREDCALLRSKLAAISCSLRKQPSSSAVSQWHDLDKCFGLAYEKLLQLRPDQNVDRFFAVRLSAYLQQVFNQMRYSLLGALGCGLQLIVAIASYAVEPKRFVYGILWVTVIAACASVVVVFVQMSRDSTLSAICDTKAGRITLDRAFVASLVLYVLVPILSLAATQFPPLGRILADVGGPLSHVLGGP